MIQLRLRSRHSENRRGEGLGPWGRGWNVVTVEGYRAIIGANLFRTLLRGILDGKRKVTSLLDAVERYSNVKTKSGITLERGVLP